VRTGAQLLVSQHLRCLHAHHNSKKGETDMKTVSRNSINLPMAAVLLAAALAGPAVAADKLVPFKGSLDAKETIVSTPGSPPVSFVADGSGDGIATHLGLFTLTWEFTVIIADGTGSGPVHLIAANGDEIFTTAGGTSEPTSTPGVFHITEVQTITGGTGRFANAKGSFIVDRLTDLNTGLTSGSFNGTITSRGEAD
jgi:hypothetical protein